LKFSDKCVFNVYFLPKVIHALSRDSPQKLEGLISRLGNRVTQEPNSTDLRSRRPKEINRSVFAELKRLQESGGGWDIKCITQSHIPFDTKLNAQKTYNIRQL